MPKLKRTKLARLARRWKKSRQIDCVDLGSGSVVEISRFSEKPGRRLHGIDSSYSIDTGCSLKERERDLTRNRSSRIRLFPEKAEYRLRKYRRESVRHFRTSFILSGLSRNQVSKWFGKEQLFRKIASQVHRALVPNGRFRIIDTKQDIARVEKILKEEGFNVSKWPIVEARYRKENRSFWGEEYYTATTREAEEKGIKKVESEYWPWVLVAVKR